MPSRSSTARAQSASSSSGRHSGAGTPRANEIDSIALESRRLAAAAGAGTGDASAAAERSATSPASSLGVVPTAIPAASSASRLACAVPTPPETIAPAWPMRLAGRRREAGDVGEHGLRARLGDVRGRLLLLVAADLADEHDELGLRVGLEAVEDVDEASSRRPGSPPMPTIVELPTPSSASSWPIW